MIELLKLVAAYVTSRADTLRRHWLLAVTLVLVGAIPTGTALFFVEQFYYTGRLETLKAQIEFLKERREGVPAKETVPENVSAKESGTAARSDGIHVTYYGYYHDPDEEKDKTMSEEALALVFDKDQTRVVGEISGDFTSQETKLPRGWIFSGFTRNDSIFLSFATRADAVTPAPSGIGGYQLRRLGSDYTGRVTLLACKDHKFYDCPYALSAQRLADKDATPLQRWPIVFSAKCKPLELTPDTPKPVVTNCGLADVSPK
jgi:hypothetical protein